MRNFLIMIAATLLMGCAAERSETGDPAEFLPESSAVILKLKDPDLFFDNLKNNQFLNRNQELLMPVELKEELEVLDLITHEKPAFLTFSAGNEDRIDFLFITQIVPEEIPPDSLNGQSLESVEIGSHEVKRFHHKDKAIYTTIKNDVLLLSNSTSLLEESLEQTSFLIDSPDFQKTLKAASKEKPVVFVNHNKLKELLKNGFSEELLSSFISFSNWSMLNIGFDHTALRLDGISTHTDTVSKLLNVFKGAGNSESTLAALTPVSATGFYSINFKDFGRLSKNLRDFRSEAPEEQEKLRLLESSDEAGMIWLKKNDIFTIRSTDIEAAQIALSRNASPAEEFRGIQIFESTEELDLQELQPLLNPENLKYFTFLSPYIAFSKTPEGLKEIIAAFQNDQVLIKSPSYISVSENLSSQSSMLLLTNNKFLQEGNENSLLTGVEGLKNLSFEGYPLGALQLIYQDDFAHVHAVLSEGEQTLETQQVSQKASVSLAANVADQPYFFKNHRTDGLDVAVQDEQNTLYLISSEGKIHWKKKMDSRIIGEIHSVDLLKNGRIQLAFATQDAIHVIDRDGNAVNPFPLKFQDAITQPLAVFDYENNRDYRFVIVQDRDIFMFNRKGERVRGFKFDRAANKIINPLKHIRIGRKDYILAQEASGQLNILSRTGKIRVPVNESLEFSENKWFEHNGQFISTNDSGQRIAIDQQGQVTKEDLPLAEAHKIAATEEVFVSLSENELNIGGNQISLDFGLYTAPQIFQLNNKTYISTTDLQAQKVYVFDSKAQLLPDFPVYGNSSVDIGNADADEAPELVVKGEEDSILIYDL